MGKIRVLIVDDAVIIRRLLADELAKDPALEVVGVAGNGKIALDKLPKLKPDIVILDIEMPEMNGLETLKEIRKIQRRLPVIMFSTMTERGASITLDALALGATDYFTKPTEAGVEASLEVIREQLIPKIKTICTSASFTVNARTSSATATAAVAASVGKPAPLKPLSPLPGITRRPQIIAIGVSTGGPTALGELLSKLPSQFPVPIVIVQHMPAVFTRMLAERLSTQSPLRVREGVSDAVLQPGEVWIAPGDFHMTVVKDARQARLLIRQDEKENSCRPSVDVLFRSVAKAFGAEALAIVLTGMGHDGTQGCSAIRDAGGTVLAQDEATSVVWGMPGNVAKAGLAELVLPLSMIADELVRRTHTII